jgi:hypothetical protein
MPCTVRYHSFQVTCYLIAAKFITRQICVIFECYYTPQGLTIYTFAKWVTVSIKRGTVNCCIYKWLCITNIGLRAYNPTIHSATQRQALILDTKTSIEQHKSRWDDETQLEIITNSICRPVMLGFGWEAPKITIPVPNAFSSKYRKVFFF